MHPDRETTQEPEARGERDLATLWERLREAERGRARAEAAEARLRDEGARLRDVIQDAPAFVAVLEGEDLTFTYANEAYYRLVGHRIIVGKPLLEALPEVAGQGYFETLTDVRTTGVSYLTRERPVTLQPEPEGPLVNRFVDLAYHAARNADGTIYGVLAHGIDVTDSVRARKDIAEREELFRTVFEQAPDDAILVMDLDRTLNAWNPAAERITGWSAAEAIGQPADIIFTTEDRVKGAPAWETETAARDGKATDERWHVRKDGTRFWGSGTMNALHGADGEVRGFLKVFRDATVRHEETRTLAFMSRLSEAMIEGRGAADVVTTAARLLAEHLDVSRVAFGVASPEGSRVTVEEEWAPGLPSLVGGHTVADFGPAVEADFRAGRTHVSRDAENEYVPGRALEAIRAIGAMSGLSVPLLREGRFAGLLVIHHRAPRDWSDAEIALARQVADRLSTEVGRRKAEAALVEANATLERRVEERTRDLTRANRDLDEFAYSVAHDLRAPLRAIVSTSRLLLEDLAERLREEERTMLERQAKNGVRLARIVDDLLGFARLANADLERGPVDLTEVARQTAAEIMERAWAIPPRIVVAEDLRAEGDPRLLGYVLTNLIDNAVKFSPEGAEVAVGGVNGAFFVRDRGIGFDMAHAPKLFVAFERLVDMESFAGTGVGLANVKRIVERHGGQVWAESEPGKGSTFWFTLG